MKKYMVGDEIHNRAFKHLFHDLGVYLHVAKHQFLTTRNQETCIKVLILTWSIACIAKLNVMNSQIGLSPA